MRAGSTAAYVLTTSAAVSPDCWSMRMSRGRPGRRRSRGRPRRVADSRPPGRRDAVDLRDIEVDEQVGNVVIDGVDRGEAVTECGQTLTGEGQRLGVPVDADHPRVRAGREQGLAVAAMPSVASTRTAPGRAAWPERATPRCGRAEPERGAGRPVRGWRSSRVPSTGWVWVAVRPCARVPIRSGPARGSRVGIVRLEAEERGSGVVGLWGCGGRAGRLGGRRQISPGTTSSEVSE